MARATMANLISYVRDRIGDPAGASQVFSDDQIQAAFDATRYDVYNEFLEPVYSFVNGALVYLDHYSRWGFWEDSPTLLDMGLQTITPDSSELLLDRARFHWNANQFPPIRAYGKSYDPWRVAADLLEEMIAGQVLNQINFSANGQSFSLNQIIQARQQLVAQYRAKQRIMTIETRREDVMSEVEWKRLRKIDLTSAGVPFIDGQ